MSFFQKSKLQKLVIFSSAFLASGTLWAVSTLPVSAAANQLYLTPASLTQEVGTTFSVNLRVNPAGAAIDTVNAIVSYDNSALSLQGVDCTGSPLTPAPNQALGCPTSGNPVTITSATFSGAISSDSFVAKLTFKALASSGTSNISVTGDTAAGGNSLGASGSAAQVSFTAPAAPTCAAGQTGTYPNCVTPPSGTGTGGTSGTSSGGSSKPTSGGSSKPSGGTSTTTTSTTPAGNGTATVSSKDLKFTQATFTVASKDPTQVSIQFGTDKSALTQHTDFSDLATTHKISIDPQQLTPGQTYYYVIVSKTQAGAVTQTSVDSFTMNGLTVRIGVFDKNSKPLSGKTVTLHSTPMTATTDSKGFANFANIVPGLHQVIYTSGGKTYTQQVTVQNNVTTAGDTQTAPVQTVSVVYNLTASKSLASYRLVILGLLLAVVIVAIILFSQRKIRFAVAGGAPLSVAPVVVGGKTRQPEGTPVTSGGTSSKASKAVETSQRLSSIPTPDKPLPGSTVTPISQERKRF